MYGMNILRGELLLDREYPEWLSVIDTRRLDLNSTSRCVLGQISMHAEPDEGESWSNYQAALERFGLDPEANEYNDANPHRLGFDAFVPSEVWTERATEDSLITGGSYATLTREWQDAIADRRERTEPDPPAYAFDAALHHAECILIKLGALTAQENDARQFSVEHALDRLAEDYGVTRSDVDLNVFPVSVHSDAAFYREDGTRQSCDTCLQVIEP